MHFHAPKAGISRAAGAAFCLLMLVGCRSIGPATVARDRYDYSSSISESWKRQTLLNIVKLRYLDPPIFVDVGQIVAGYSLETGLNVGGQVSSASAIQGNSLLLGTQGKFTDRPTVTYTPLTGNQFVKALMTPLAPESIFFTIQSGWPADGVLLATVASMNGLKNQETSIDGVRPPEAGFMRALEIMRELQRTGSVSLRVKLDALNQRSSVLTFRSRNVSEAALAQIRELRQLLQLDPDATEFALVFGETPSHGEELAVLTRSLLHIMITMAAQVEVPEEDVAQGRATPGSAQAEGAPEGRRLVRIQCATSKPPEASVAVSYRDHWFWIDDRDLASKRAFAFMLMLFSLSDSGQKENLPLLTIPTQ